MLTYEITVSLNPLGNVYIADTENHRIRKVAISTGIITTIAGNGGSGNYTGDGGAATSAALNFPEGVALDASGRRKYFILLGNSVTIFLLGNVYIADTGNHRVRKVAVSTGIIDTYAGTGNSSFGGDNGPATSANLSDPSGVALDSAGINFLVLHLRYSLDFLPLSLPRQRIHR